MKYLIVSLVLFFGLILPARAQVIVLGVAEKPAPTLEDYERVLKFYKTAAKEVVDLDAWKGRELIHKLSKEKIQFDKLSEFDKHMYLLSQGYRINMVNLSNFDEFWKMELKKFDNPKYEPKKRDKIDSPKQNPAQKADVEKYINALTELRKDSAKKYEVFVEKVCSKYKDEIPEKERELYLKEVREFNDENKLIERKK